jgi:hypothetical protein
VDAPQIIRLRELARFEEELKIELRRVTNRLWQVLHRYYPQVLKLSPAADERFAWDQLNAAPTPIEGARLPLEQVQSILRTNRIRRVTADEVLTALRAVPLVLAPGALEAACEHVSFLLPQVRLLDQQLRDTAHRIKEILTALAESANGKDEPPSDTALMLSIPGIGPAVAATLLTEAARFIRDRDYAALRCYSGTAPITRQSGKRKSVQMRYACNPRL